MHTKDKNEFHEALVSQYKELIHEAVLESDHKEYLDSDMLEKKLTTIAKSAKYEGLTDKEIFELIHEAKITAPSHKKAS